MLLKDLKETQEMIDSKELKVSWLILWNKDTNKVGIYDRTEKGFMKIIESNTLQKKPKWVKGTIEILQSEKECCTAHRDEKITSLPHHTKQASRNKHSGDTNSATAYESNTKRMGVTDRRGRNKNEAKNTTRKGA